MRTEAKGGVTQPRENGEFVDARKNRENGESCRRCHVMGVISAARDVKYTLSSRLRSTPPPKWALSHYTTICTTIAVGVSLSRKLSSTKSN
ncbi:hypothetical protein LSAT2_007423, partial [Lamellibrachia satsuma]